MVFPHRACGFAADLPPATASRGPQRYGRGDPGPPCPASSSGRVCSAGTIAAFVMRAAPLLRPVPTRLGRDLDDSRTDRGMTRPELDRVGPDVSQDALEAAGDRDIEGRDRDLA